MFSVKADNPYRAARNSAVSVRSGAVACAKVAKTMTKEQPASHDSPEHLESAQSNRV
jgi:hypothetical protein